MKGNRYVSVDSEEQAYKQRRLVEEMADKDKACLLELLSSSWGRWFLMRLFDRCYLFSDTFTGNSKTFQLEGMRKVGLLYLQDISSLGVEAIKLKQEAELEYVKAQEEFLKLIEAGIEKEEFRSF